MEPLTPEQMERAASLTLGILILGLVVFGLLGSWGLRAVEWWHARSVKPIPSSSYSLMSSNADANDEDPPSSGQTDDGQTADGRMIARPTPAQMLDIFRVARASGIKRDPFAAAIRAAGLPFDNNLWAQAAPPPPQAVSPIAGRPIDPALFHADAPDLRYRPLGEE